MESVRGSWVNFPNPKNILYNLHKWHRIYMSGLGGNYIDSIGESLSGAIRGDCEKNTDWSCQVSTEAFSTSVSTMPCLDSISHCDRYINNKTLLWMWCWSSGKLEFALIVKIYSQCFIIKRNCQNCFKRQQLYMFVQTKHKSWNCVSSCSAVQHIPLEECTHETLQSIHLEKGLRLTHHLHPTQLPKTLLPRLQ